MSATVSTIEPELPGGTGGVSVDRQGNLFVADFGAVLSDHATMGRRIFRIDREQIERPARVEQSGRAERAAQIKRPAQEPRVFATGFEGASGNEFDSNGYLYQSNIRGNYISRIAPDGSHEIFAREGIVAPVGIALDGNDTLFVANCGDQSIQRISRDGRSELFVRDDLLVCPNGLTFDDEHNLYVANFDNGDVVKITPERQVSRLASLPGRNNGHLTFFDGALFVVARSDHRIYRVSLDGEAVPFAGSGERGHVDGPAERASFSLPNDIAPGPDGRTLYINEIASTTNDPTQLAPMVVRRIRFE